jgi:Tfp pilus assembly PilM family ATPase
MIPWLQRRRSTISFDVGASGMRACQLRRCGRRVEVCDALDFERPLGAGQTKVPEPVIEPGRLEGLVGRGTFAGRNVTLVLSPPEVQFFPITLPVQALSQDPARIEQALKCEVAQQSRRSESELEVRFWTLPASRAQMANVMAVVLRSELALGWAAGFAQQRLHLHRIEAAPCALVHLAASLWPPIESELWGVLDLGLRGAVLTVVVGTVPTYIRVLSASAHEWTQQLARAFDIPSAVAERLKRERGIQPARGDLRVNASAPALAGVTDLASAFGSVLREPLTTLTRELRMCLSYVMQNFPEVSLGRLVLAGGGANLRGLPEVIQESLDVPVSLLRVERGAEQSADDAAGPRLIHGDMPPQSAACVGAAMLDLSSGRPPIADRHPRAALVAEGRP